MSSSSCLLILTHHNSLLRFSETYSQGVLCHSSSWFLCLPDFPRVVGRGVGDFFRGVIGKSNFNCPGNDPLPRFVSTCVVHLFVTVDPEVTGTVPYRSTGISLTRHYSVTYFHYRSILYFCPLCVRCLTYVPSVPPDSARIRFLMIEE